MPQLYPAHGGRAGFKTVAWRFKFTCSSTGCLKKKRNLFETCDFDWSNFQFLLDMNLQPFFSAWSLPPCRYAYEMKKVLLGQL